MADAPAEVKAAFEHCPRCTAFLGRHSTAGEWVATTTKCTAFARKGSLFCGRHSSEKEPKIVPKKEPKIVSGAVRDSAEVAAPSAPAAPAPDAQPSKRTKRSTSNDGLDDGYAPSAPSAPSGPDYAQIHFEHVVMSRLDRMSEDISSILNLLGASKQACIYWFIIFVVSPHCLPHGSGLRPFGSPQGASLSAALNCRSV
jgi:hypothetical protein